MTTDRSEPWWALPGAVDIWNTRLTKEVACETCQCIPVPKAEGGIRVVSSLKLRMEW